MKVTNPDVKPNFTPNFNPSHCLVCVTDPDMDRLLRLGGGMPGLGQVRLSLNTPKILNVNWDPILHICNTQLCSALLTH